jgi:hypothetical protein
VPEGRKLPALVVLLVSRERHDNQAGGMAQAASDGSFTMNLPAGDYDVALASTGPGDDLYVAGIRLGDSDALTSGVHVAGEALARLEILLNANGGTVECSVSDLNDEPLPNMQVILIPDPPRQSQMALYSDCRTDATGSCKVTGVAPGEYHGFAFAQEEERDFRDPDILKEFEKFGKPVKIAEGDRHKLELKAIPEQN